MNKLTISYTSNFKILELNQLKNYKYFFKKGQIKKRKRIFCKNFLLFLLLINYFTKKKIFINTSFFFLKKKNKLFTILRAPYRYKLARDQLTFSRYIFLCCFFFKQSNDFVFFNYTDLFIYLKLFENFFFFETNICFQKKIKIFISVNFNNFLKIKNFF